jgi:hypothetical protein
MTPYSNIFTRFERMITDFDLDGIIIANKEQIEIELLSNAVAEYINSVDDLTRDDTLKQFANVLSEQSEKILANYMVQGWCKPYVYSQDLFETNFSTMEYQKFSSAELMLRIQNLMTYAQREAGRLSTKVSVKNVIGRLK